jgi:hypothetical protein
MSELVQYKYKKHTIETIIYSRKDIEAHDEEVEKYKNDDWKEIHMLIGYENNQPIKRTVLEKCIPILQRGLRAKNKSIDDACDIKDKIKELIQRYKYNISTSTVTLYEEFMKDLEELIK